MNVRGLLYACYNLIQRPVLMTLKGITMKTIKAIILAIFLLTVTQSHAAFITLQEAPLDAIFSQSNFGNDIIDIRIGAATELVYPALLDITTDAEISQLFGLHVGAANIVNFYFVDTISSCGIVNPAIVGCGEFPGNDFVVESSFAAGGYGGELLAHELGHNLGLAHRADANALMNSALNNGTTLTASEVLSIRSSPLVQGDSTNGFFININPVLIVARATNAISEPSIVFLMFSFIVLMGLNSKRKAK